MLFFGNCVLLHRKGNAWHIVLLQLITYQKCIRKKWSFLMAPQDRRFSLQLWFYKKYHVCVEEERLHMQVCQSEKKKTNIMKTQLFWTPFHHKKLEDIVLLMLLMRYVTNTCALTHVLHRRQSTPLRVRLSVVKHHCQKNVCQHFSFLSQCTYSHIYLVKFPTHSNPRTLQDTLCPGFFPSCCCIFAQGK